MVVYGSFWFLIERLIRTALSKCPVAVYHADVLFFKRWKTKSVFLKIIINTAFFCIYRNTGDSCHWIPHQSDTLDDWIFLSTYKNPGSRNNSIRMVLVIVVFWLNQCGQYRSWTTGRRWRHRRLRMNRKSSRLLWGHAQWLHVRAFVRSVNRIELGVIPFWLHCRRCAFLARRL